VARGHLGLSRCAEACENERMAAVARLLTFVDIADHDDDGPDARRMSVSARHEAVLADGRRVVLLEDRGWSEELGVFLDDEPSEEARGLVEPFGIWAYETVEEMERTGTLALCCFSSESRSGERSMTRSPAFVFASATARRPRGRSTSRQRSPSFRRPGGRPGSSWRAEPAARPRMQRESP
jgi:hypothetical protein